MSDALDRVYEAIDEQNAEPPCAPDGAKLFRGRKRANASRGDEFAERLIRCASRLEVRNERNQARRETVCIHVASSLT